MDSDMELNLLSKAFINIDSLNENIKQSNDILIRSEKARDTFRGKYQEIMNNVPDRLKKYVKGVLNKIELSMDNKIAKQKLAIESSNNGLLKINQAFNEINDNQYRVTDELNLSAIDSEIKSIYQEIENLAFFDFETYSEKNVSYKIINSLSPEVKDIIAKSVSDFNQENSAFLTVMQDIDRTSIDAQREILVLQRDEQYIQQDYAKSVHQYNESSGVNIISEQLASFMPVNKESAITRDMNGGSLGMLAPTLSVCPDAYTCLS